MKTIKTILTLILVYTSLFTIGQSKKELKSQINQLKQEKSSLKTKLDRISNINIDNVITPDKQPKDIVIGESGWRTELNGTKYKSDLIGQLGTLWIADSNNQIQPQGAISLTDYKIDPLLINPEKDVIYKTFISKGTQLQGEGGPTFVKITAALKLNQFSNFSITIEGTSLIKPKISDLKKVSNEVNDLFSLKKIKGIFICTGMHVVRYHSIAYDSCKVDAKITSPVVNIGGSFYAESSEESSEYYVARQLTQLYKQEVKDSITANKQLAVLSNSQVKISDSVAKKYTPVQLINFVTGKSPSFNEYLEFQSKPDKYISNISTSKNLSENEKILLNVAKEKVTILPNQINSLEKPK